MGISRFVLKMLPGIQRPAIASLLPSLKGHTCVLDLGANVKCEAEHFLQFGVMGACLFSAIGGKTKPSIGLLNIGEEDIKGNEVVKAASDLLKKRKLSHKKISKNNSRFFVLELSNLEEPFVILTLCCLFRQFYCKANRRSALYQEV